MILARWAQTFVAYHRCTHYA